MQTIQQIPFETVAQWLIHRIVQDTLPAPEESSGQSAAHYYRWYTGLLADMASRPVAYQLPTDRYVEEYETPQSELPNHAEIQDQRMRAKKAVEQGILDFLYQVGQAGQPSGESLLVDRSTYNRILADIRKKNKKLAFLDQFALLGLVIAEGDPVSLSAPGYPGLPNTLAAFARACAATGRDGFFFFRRCDFDVQVGKTLPTLADALRLVPEPARQAILQTDVLLKQRKFRREIQINPWTDAGYRLRYSKKNDQVVYWCRIHNWTYEPLFHHLRWDMSSDLTGRMFAYLDAHHPGLAERVFQGTKECKHCYPNCAARAILTYHGTNREVCSETGWCDLGITPSEFENLRTVITALDESW